MLRILARALLGGAGLLGQGLPPKVNWWSVSHHNSPCLPVISVPGMPSQERCSEVLGLDPTCHPDNTFWHNMSPCQYILTQHVTLPIYSDPTCHPANIFWCNMSPSLYILNQISPWQHILTPHITLPIYSDTTWYPANILRCHVPPCKYILTLCVTLHIYSGRTLGLLPSK